MKTLKLALLATLMTATAQAQKFDYRDGVLNIDGTDVAKIEKIKDSENMGLTSTFEVSSMDGEKIIIATWAGEFEQDPNNNTDHFYRLSFLTANQVGIFNVSKLGTEKSFAKLLGKSGIFVNGKPDEKKVQEFIARKGRSPKVAVDYTLVSRNKSWPLRLTTEKTITQQDRVIGHFTDITPKGASMDSYEFRLPSGVLVARVSFTGGNNAQNCEIHTMKDNYKRVVPMASPDKVDFLASAIDRNQLVLERIVKWMVSNQYL